MDIETQLRELWATADISTIIQTEKRAQALVDAHLAAGGELSDEAVGYIEGIGRILDFKQDMQRMKRLGMVAM